MAHGDKKTRAAYEAYLNELYSETLTREEAVEKFGHLTSTDYMIGRMYRDRKLGTLLKNNDPIAFNVGYGDWCLKS